MLMIFDGVLTHVSVQPLTIAKPLDCVHEISCCIVANHISTKSTDINCRSKK